MAPKALETIKAKFKSLLKGKKSKKAEADTPAAATTKTEEPSKTTTAAATEPTPEATTEPEAKTSEPAADTSASTEIASASADPTPAPGLAVTEGTTGAPKIETPAEHVPAPAPTAAAA